MFKYFSFEYPLILLYFSSFIDLFVSIYFISTDILMETLIEFISTYF